MSAVNGDVQARGLELLEMEFARNSRIRCTRGLGSEERHYEGRRLCPLRAAADEARHDAALGAGMPGLLRKEHGTETPGGDFPSGS